MTIIADKKNKWVLYVVLVLAIIINIGLCSFRLRNAPFDQDEFEHMHVAWNISTGKVIYRDFFQIHGPIFALLNGTLIKQFNLAPKIKTIFKFRFMGLLYSIFILFFTPIQLDNLMLYIE